MSYTQVDTLQKNKKSTIAIRPYVDQNIENMGLEAHNMALFEGAYYEEQLACLEMNGVKRYITGLNEYSPDVKKLDDTRRKAKIKEIRQIVSELEKELAQNILNIDDEDFWNKVILLKPNNSEFWNKVTIKVGNEPTYLHLDKPHDLIKYYAILAGGFSCIASSLDYARSVSKPPKFYLDKHDDTLNTTTSYTIILNKAISKLVDLSETNANKLLYIAKCLNNNSVSYTKSTLEKDIYKDMDAYVRGAGVESNKQRAAKSFIEIAEESMENLIIRSIVKDATFLKLIVYKSDGMVHMTKGDVILGRTNEDVIEFLKNPLNEDILDQLKEETDKYFNM